MPFKSKAQQRWMYATHPEMASEWSMDTDFKKLPERVTKKRDEGEKAALEMFSGKEAAMTASFLRTVARDNDFDLKSPENQAKIQGLTGTKTLKDMSSSQLQQVASMIWQKEAAEKKKKAKKRSFGEHMLSAEALGGALAPSAANLALNATINTTPGSGKQDFARPGRFDKLTKQMGMDAVPMASHPEPVAGTVQEFGKPDALGVGLPKGVSEAFAAHELGHVKNWRALGNVIGEKNVPGLLQGLSGLQGLSELTTGPLSAYAASSDDPTWTPGLIQAGLSAPRMLDEALASLHAVRHLTNRHGVLKGLGHSLPLLPAYGTYAALAGAPLAITAGRKLWRHYKDQDQK